MKDTAVLLLIEEDIQELYAFEKGLRDGGVLNPVRIARYSSEARCYLEGVGVYQDRGTYPLPAVVFLDLSMGPDGAAFDLLRRLRAKSYLKDVPVIALGRRNTRKVDIQRLFDLGGNGFFVKHEEMHDVVAFVKSLFLIEIPRSTADLWKEEF